MTFDPVSYRKAWRIKNPHYFEEYREKNRAKILQYMRDNKGKWVTPTRIQKLRHPEAHAARVALNIAVASKKIIRPKNCEDCGRTGRVHGHHDDYSKHLQVRWLCPLCHGAVHRILNKELRK